MSYAPSGFNIMKLLSKSQP